MAKSYRYAVQGLWPFPLDMLRRDQSEALTDTDKFLIEDISEDSRPDHIPDREHTIKLTGPNVPNVERWNSFGWKVIEIEETGDKPRWLHIHPPVAEQVQKPLRSIDLTPTWKACMPILITALQDGTPTGKRLAREELMELADRLDSLNIEPTTKEG